MNSFVTEYNLLNKQQKEAVDCINGPLLVIAGPGTGKTQLLSLRVANILDKTDTLAENILCLTYTESGAQTMRNRLASFIGQSAYDVRIGTYHAFGNEIIRNYAEYFEDDPSLVPIDDLGIDTILRKLFDDLPFSSLLKSSQAYLNDLRTFIGDSKRALLNPDDLKKISNNNLDIIENLTKLVKTELATVVTMNKDAMNSFVNLQNAFSAVKAPLSYRSDIPNLFVMANKELEEANNSYLQTNKTTQVTKWKNKWLAKDYEGNWVFEGKRSNQKVLAAAKMYESYQKILIENNLFDYDDMIMRAVKGLQLSDDVRYTLQEKYQYILLDEFQDTNPAQLKLVELLCNNPVNEGRPNVMAVGDDDQAIYSFQGSDYSNMLTFKNMFVDTAVVALTANYRSHADVLHVAHNIAEQIEHRLHHEEKGIKKVLTAESKLVPKDAVIARHEFVSDISQYAWVAEKIEKLQKAGVPYKEIVVLAPKHKFLEPLIPFLQQKNIPVHYQKRENILDAPLIKELLTMAELVVALSENKASANELWSVVLSYDFWNLPTSLIWELSWKSFDDRTSWDKLLFENELLKPICLFFFKLSNSYNTEIMETMLDYLTGIEALDLKEESIIEPFMSPFKNYYFDNQPIASNYWNALTLLAVLRSHLRNSKPTKSGSAMYLSDLLSFYKAHELANIPILNTNPHQESEDAVQIMTAFKAKGQEFEAVILLCSTDEVWGTKSRSHSSNITLPYNLSFIRYAGATNDERLRLLFVAVTRAKSHLFLTSYASNMSGKATVPLKYLDEIKQEGKTFSRVLPAKYADILQTEFLVEKPETLELFWQQRHINGLKNTSLKNLLAPRLQKFKLSATHLNGFINVSTSSPDQFYLNTILRFPSGMSPSGQYGNAMHETLKGIHNKLRAENKTPTVDMILDDFRIRMNSKGLNKQNTVQYLERGTNSLKLYLKKYLNTFDINDEHEFDFANQGVTLGDVILTGKIDKLQINQKTKTIIVTDYKTGQSANKWSNSDAKLLNFRRQLCFYKILIENSNKYRGFVVEEGIIEYVEPDENNEIQKLRMTFDDETVNTTKQLIRKVWEHIQALNFPDTSNYSKNSKGVLEFVDDILNSKI
ncbi:MAG: ATP-dependent DNA helicase [Candidatus Saccharibacteria bacterium]